MRFTSLDFLGFLGVIFVLFWAFKRPVIRKMVLLVGSYIFYGYVHPWFCILITISIFADYYCALGMTRKPEIKKQLLWVSLAVNLGMLGAFKYFGFFVSNFCALFDSMGLNVSIPAMNIVLPVGISFYTFQTLSYTIDVYRGDTRARTNFLDFATFVALFPQLVAGPIERARTFLPQLESLPKWRWQHFVSAWPLFVWGFFKKMVIADNVSVYVDKIFMLKSPSLLLLLVGSLGFAVQIYADFSGYTDIARGTARLLGFELTLNFNAPYLAISPSDFWRRWHITFSSWIRDYLYIPLGGSRVKTKTKFALVLVTSLGLSGLWHGAAWHFVAWGVYHAVIMFIYHALGMGGRWKPSRWYTVLSAWACMFLLTLFGWLLFRTSSMGWLTAVVKGASVLGSKNEIIASVTIFFFVVAYSLPMMLLYGLEVFLPKHSWLRAIVYGFAIVGIVIFARDSQSDFIYFQF